MPKLSPFLGVFYDSLGNLISLLKGEPIAPQSMPHGMSPFNGVFYDENGNLHDLTELFSSGNRLNFAKRGDFPEIGNEEYLYIATDEEATYFYANDKYVCCGKSVDNSIVFSAERPTGNWKIWLKDEGEIPDYPEPEDPVETIIFDTAPLDAPGDFAVMYDETDGETLLNMTDNSETAGDDDIIIVDN